MINSSLTWAGGDDFTPEMIVRDLKSVDVSRQLHGVCLACRLLCTAEPPVTLMLEAGVIAPLVDALDRHDCPSFQHHALDVLSDVAFGSCEHTVTVANSGAIPKLISFLPHDADLAERAIMFLGNFSLHGLTARDAVLVQAMLPHMRTDTPIRRLRTFVRAYSNFCSLNDDENDKTNFELVSPALPYIHDILDIENEKSLDIDDKEIPFIACDVIVDACTALTNIMFGPDECIKAVQATPGLTTRLVGLLGHATVAVREAALGAVGNMLAGTDEQVDRCLEAACLPHLMSLLQSSSPSLVKEAVRATGNMLAGTHAQIQLALNKLVLILLNNLLVAGHPKCQQQALHALTCLCVNGSATQRNQVITSGVLRPCAAKLEAEDPAVSRAALDALYELMKAAERDGGVKLLCYMLDELDVVDRMQLLPEDETDENRSKVSDMCTIIRRHAREERSVVQDGKIFTAVDIVQDLEAMSDPATYTRAARAANDMLSIGLEHAPVHAMLEAGIMPRLLEALDSGSYFHVHNATIWAFTIASGSPRNRMAVEDSGVIPKLVALLSYGGEISQFAGMTLGLMSLHGPAAKNAARACMHSDITLTGLRDYVRSYKYSCREAGVTLSGIYMLTALSFIADLLDIGDQTILEDACLAIAYLSKGGVEVIENLQKVPGLTARLVGLLGDRVVVVRGAALEAVGNMLLWTFPQVERCISAGCIRPIVSLLRAGPACLQQLAGRAAALLLAGPPAQIQLALDAGILRPLRTALLKGDDECKKQAVHAITCLCRLGSLAQHQQLAASRALRPYCALLGTGRVLTGLLALIQAAEKEGKLKDICMKFYEIGVLDKLQRLLEFELDQVSRENAVSVCYVIRRHARGERIIYVNGNIFTIADIVQGLQSPHLQHDSVRLACIMLSEEKPPITEMVGGGVVALLVAVLDRNDCPDLQQAVTNALIVINSGTHQHRVAVAHSGAIPKLVALLSFGDKRAELAAWALATMSTGAPVTRDRVLRGGAVEALLPYLRRDTPLGLLRSCAALYLSLCIALVSSPMVKLVLTGLPYICDLLDIEDKAVLHSVCGALTNLVNDPEDSEAIQGAQGLATRLVRLLLHESDLVKEAALTTLGNMLAGNETQAERYVAAGCLLPLPSLLRSCSPLVVGEAIRVACNLLAHSPRLIQPALEGGILAPILVILADAEPNSFLQDYAVSSLAHITSLGTREHKMAVVHSGVIPKLVEVLSLEDAVAAEAARALGGAASAGGDAALLVVSRGAARGTLRHLRPAAEPELLQHCVTAYRSYCRHDEKSAEKLEFLLPALPHLSELLGVEDEFVLENTCWALVSLTKTYEGVEAVQATPGLTTRLVGLLSHEAASVKETASHAIMLMLSGTDTQVDCCLAADCVEHVISYLECRDPALMEKATRAARGALGAERPRAPDSLTPLMLTLACNGPCPVRTVRAICNLHRRVAGEARARLVSRGALQACGALLASREPARAGPALAALHDSIQVAVNDGDLKQIKQIRQQLVELGVLDQLKLLQEHEDKEINEKARLLNTYLLP